MKLLVKTTGPYGFMDMESGCEIQPFRPSVVAHSNYLSTLMASRKVELLCNSLLEEATDVEFLGFYVESNRDADLAVDAFLAKFDSKAVVTPATEEDEKKAKAEAAEADKKAKASAKAAAAKPADAPKE